MGKKKRKKEKDGELKEKAGQKKKIFSPVIIVGILAVLALTIFLATKNDQAGAPEKPLRISPVDLIETNPVLSPAAFYGRTALAYQHAAEIPEVLDNQFCYCYCRKNAKHKTLLTCFTNNHGANCGICQSEVFRSYQLHKEGLSISEIVKKIDKEFYRKPL